MPNLSTMALLFVVEGTVMTGTAGKKSRCLCTNLSLMLHDEEKKYENGKNSGIWLNLASCWASQHLYPSNAFDPIQRRNRY